MARSCAPMHVPPAAVMPPCANVLMTTLYWLFHGNHAPGDPEGAGIGDDSFFTPGRSSTAGEPPAGAADTPSR